MNNLHANRVGMVVAVLFGLWHAGWSFLVMIGWAQPLIDFVLRLHFIRPVYVVESFNSITALTLVAFTTLIGYAMGFVAGVLWNKLHAN